MAEEAVRDGMEKGSLTILHKDSGVPENTIGRVLSLPEHLILLTPDAVFKDVPSEMVEYLKDKWKDVNWKGNLEVYLNHSPLFKQLKRLYSSERRVNLFLRLLLGTPATIINSLAGKLWRANSYNPFTESAQVFHSNPAIAMHEVGHMENYNKSRHPGLRALAYGLPIVRSSMEWTASNEAMKRLNEKERDAAKKVLEPAFGTHAGFDFGRIMRVVCPPLAKPYELAGAMLGHLHSRLFKKNIFFNEKSVVNQSSASLAPVAAMV